MRRGTTPTFTFTIPYTAAQIEEGYITFEQHNKIIVEKAIGNTGVGVSDNTITVLLSQEETLAFSVDPCCVQIRLLLSGDIAVASNIVEFDATRIIKQGEI